MALYLSESANSQPYTFCTWALAQRISGSPSETILHSDFPEPELSWTGPPTQLVSGEHQSEAEVDGLVIPTDL